MTQKTAKVVDLFLDKTMEEVAEEMDIDVRTVQRKINEFIAKCSQ
jgi:predicted transcriptional regulator